MISAHELYLWEEVRRRLRWKRHSARQAQRMGMAPVKFGSRLYIAGQTVLDFFARLAQQQAAAARDGEWGRDYWSGVTTSGRRITVETSGYRDRDWHRAYQAVVKSELLQAIGRGRGVCPNGISVVVLSNENLGLRLAEADFHPLGDTAIEVLKALAGWGNAGMEPAGELRQQNPTISTSGNCCLSSAEIGGLVHKTRQRVDSILGDLLRRSLVERIGQRGGWRITAAGSAFLSSAAPPEVRAGGSVRPATTARA